MVETKTVTKRPPHDKLVSNCLTSDIVIDDVGIVSGFQRWQTIRQNNPLLEIPPGYKPPSDYRGKKSPDFVAPTGFEGWGIGYDPLDFVQILAAEGKITLDGAIKLHPNTTFGKRLQQVLFQDVDDPEVLKWIEAEFLAKVGIARAFSSTRLARYKDFRPGDYRKETVNLVDNCSHRVVYCLGSNGEIVEKYSLPNVRRSVPGVKPTSITYASIRSDDWIGMQLMERIGQVVHPHIRYYIK